MGPFVIAYAVSPYLERNYGIRTWVTKLFPIIIYAGLISYIWLADWAPADQKWISLVFLLPIIFVAMLVDWIVAIFVGRHLKKVN
jgi:hypothetical protein